VSKQIRDRLTWPKIGEGFNQRDFSVVGAKACYLRDQVFLG
jgi:hypothetical protein